MGRRTGDPPIVEVRDYHLVAVLQVNESKLRSYTGQLSDNPGEWRAADVPVALELGLAKVQTAHVAKMPSDRRRRT